MQLGPVLYPEIEQQLLSVQLNDPRGEAGTCRENNKQWTQVLKVYLVGLFQVESINGGSWRWQCSDRCLDEECLYIGKKMQFVDTARFTLANCVHTSCHLQCIASAFILGDGCTTCPIMDTHQCKNTKEAHGNYGQANFWAPEDYYNFAKAFLRTRALTEVFLKPEFR